jgi:two-component system NtrC family sensor kinase
VTGPLRAPRDEPPAAGQPLRVPSHHDVLRTVLELSRNITVDMHADEVVHGYIDALNQLLPDRLLCMRLFGRESDEVSLVYATGRLRPERRDAVEITAQALARHSVVLSRDDARRVAVVEGYTPSFQKGEQGFDVPIMDGEVLAGILCVEYAAGDVRPDDEPPLVVQLAMQLGSALRNSRLHRESVYLRDYLSKLLDHANAPIMVMGKNGEVSFANRAFLATTAFKRHELLGKDWLSLWPESQRNHLLPIYINALRGEPTTNLEVKLPRRDGSSAHVAVNTASILSADGDVEAVIYIFRDITEVRELESQIIHAEKLATLGQLAAGVVHELNNPLTSISVYGEQLMKAHAAGDPRDVAKLGRIVQSADRILKFTRDLVSYARPSSEAPVLMRITEAIDQAISFCEHLVDETGTIIRCDYDPDLAPLYGVKGQLVQVFVNLVTNACHAMPMGAGRLVIRTESADDGRLRVQVTDNGKGIPENDLDRIFEPFFSTKGEGKGTGLGLSIVANIVEQHKGAIRVSSEVGMGSTFEVELPCRPELREP